MADNTANANSTIQQAGTASQYNYYGQGPAKSADTSNLRGALGSALPPITYAIDASPAQLATLIERIRQDRDNFSLLDVPPALDQELRKAGRRSVGGGGFGGIGGGYNHQLKGQAARDAEQSQTKPSEIAPSQNGRGKQGQADAEAGWNYKLRDQNLNPQAGAAPAGSAQSQSQPAAPSPATQQPPAPAKTHVVFLLTVADRIAAPPVPAPRRPRPPRRRKGNDVRASKTGSLLKVLAIWPEIMPPGRDRRERKVAIPVECLLGVLDC